MKVKGARNKKGVKRILNKWGYYEVFQPLHPLAKKNGYIREHRMIAYDAGILTDPSLEIHHKNGIKTDNRPENLEAMTKSRHTSITWKGRKQPEWTNERREAVSRRMRRNTNWMGKSENPDLISSEPKV